MLLHLLHRTRYVYAGPVHDSFNEVRLRPAEDGRQRCRRFELRVEPKANRVREYVDYYGNRVHYLDVSAAHHELVIEAESEVETIADAPPPEVSTELPGSESGPRFELQAEYLASSQYVPLDDGAWPGTDVVFGPAGRSGNWADAMQIGRHVFRSVRYQPDTTGVHTLATDVLALRAGVCQDFAHVMLGLCRRAGIPARYVSGYFLNRARRPGESEASHAWVEVYVPDHGWAGYDPTHDRRIDERYVQIAAGRDYGDIRPISGTYRGAPTREMRVDVTVRDASGVRPAG